MAGRPRGGYAPAVGRLSVNKPVTSLHNWRFRVIVGDAVRGNTTAGEWKPHDA